jgi:dTDP-glucose 4,6-dehydratase/UDP-glucuronate decarboxylase
MKTNVIEEDILEIISEFEEDLSKLKGKTILVTGGNGFLASYLVDVLNTVSKKQNLQIKLIVLNKHEVTENSRLSHLLNDPEVEFIAQDVGKPFEVPRTDIIIHAASHATPMTFKKYPLETIDANVNGVRTLLDYAKNNPVENFIFFSSNAAYEVDSLDLRAPYTESKRFAETLCATYFREYGVPIKILRIYHTYGPGMRPDKAVSEFFGKAEDTGGKVALRDEGRALFSFSYVADVTREILKVMFNGENGSAVEIGSNSKISIKDLAKLIEGLHKIKRHRE